jgi:transcriptional regulator with XRE-family HTH domain
MNTPAERIKWALEQRGISAAELGHHLGVSRSAVSQWFSKRKPTSPLKRIEQVSNFLNLDLLWLLTGHGNPLRENSKKASSIGSGSARAVDIAGALLVGVAEGETWREGNPPKLRDAPRFAFEVRGISTNQTIIPGEYAICVDYRQARPAGPQQEDLVVVKKLRGNEYKIFIGRLHYREKTWELHYESHDPRWQRGRRILLSEDLTRDAIDHCDIEIIGYVLGVFRANPRPLFDHYFDPTAMPV